jgi:hypothetical protein
MFLLDTNAVSELCELPSGRANAGVAGWAASVSSAKDWKQTKPANPDYRVEP